MVGYQLYSGYDVYKVPHPIPTCSLVYFVLRSSICQGCSGPVDYPAGKNTC